MSERAAAVHFGVSRARVKKIMEFSIPPGYRRTTGIRRPKLDGFTGFIDQWLQEDLSRNRKQRHTAKRIFERLRDEHGFKGGYTTVKNYVREHGRRNREMFVPLAHAPGHAQADFGEAMVVIGGVEQKAHFFALDLPHCDACLVRAYPAAVSEAWVDGHVHAFAFFGRVPGLVGFARRNFMMPIPRFATWEALNVWLAEQCRKRQADVLRGHSESIGQRLVRDLEALSVIALQSPAGNG